MMKQVAKGEWKKHSSDCDLYDMDCRGSGSESNYIKRAGTSGFEVWTDLTFGFYFSSCLITGHCLNAKFLHMKLKTTNS